MTLEEALQFVLSKLDDCGISSMITGSFASNIHGVPRATQDADIVIEADAKALDRPYLRRWARDLEVEDRLAELLKDLGDEILMIS